jgi:hypothetical protein
MELELPGALAKLSNPFALQMGEMKKPIGSDHITVAFSF